MAPEIMLWLVNRPERDLIGSVFKEAGYDVTFIDSQALSCKEKELEDWKLLFIDMEIIQQTDEIVAFLEKLRRLTGCKVVTLSKPEFYPLIREGRFKIHHLTDNILFYPLSENELTGDARRYLGQ